MGGLHTSVASIKGLKNVLWLAASAVLFDYVEGWHGEL